MTSPEISLIIPTYQQPRHLSRVLTSVAGQEHVDRRKMEVVVADDGSSGQTEEIVDRYARSVEFPIRFTTHPHDGFQLARCRNDGVRASTGDYLLLLDGDCLIPPDHVAHHLERRRSGVAMGGYCCRLDRDVSERISEPDVWSGRYLQRIPNSELRRLIKMDRKARFYSVIRHPAKPKMFGGNIGLWRADYERVNGFDEHFRGWGGEDDDLRLRLRRAGVRIQSILRWTRTYHLWHPRDRTAPARLRDGANMDYLHRPIRLTRCGSGLVRRRPEDLSVRLVGDSPHLKVALELLPPGLHSLSYGSRASHNGVPAEIEVLTVPGTGRFSGRADCNILLTLADSDSVAKLARKADLVLSQHAYPGVDPRCQLKSHQFGQALRMILGANLCRKRDGSDLERAA